MKAVRTILAFLTFAILSSRVVALQPPTGPVILTLTGKIGEQNAPNAAAFDLGMLEKLPQQSFTTRTPWSSQPITFTGPLLRDVLSAAKAAGNTIKALALNDYQTLIPLKDARKFGVIVAHKMDGQNIPVKTKGPLFIVYPFDSDAALRSRVYYERSAWQLKIMHIE